ncbi:hypothetical protein CDAR_227641 [Caerostris darwini]|uniref:Uncharacterized protein n=1 Tax=Caerostris darwini TaxID=1538125 RepID=A0AAV4QPM2_9ARAC|nr:hypothetical protein CDAR_227641 [Caerostris darwini]
MRRKVNYLSMSFKSNFKVDLQLIPHEFFSKQAPWKFNKQLCLNPGRRSFTNVQSRIQSDQSSSWNAKESISTHKFNCVHPWNTQRSLRFIQLLILLNQGRKFCFS